MGQEAALEANDRASGTAYLRYLPLGEASSRYPRPWPCVSCLSAAGGQEDRDTAVGDLGWFVPWLTSR